MLVNHISSSSTGEEVGQYGWRKGDQIIQEVPQSTRRTWVLFQVHSTGFKDFRQSNDMIFKYFTKRCDLTREEGLWKARIEAERKVQ